MTTTGDASLTNKAIPLVKNPLKRAYCISDRTVVVTDEEIVKRLEITEATWFLQEEVEGGIMLKVRVL